MLTLFVIQLFYSYLLYKFYFNYINYIINQQIITFTTVSLIFIFIFPNDLLIKNQNYYYFHVFINIIVINGIILYIKYFSTINTLIIFFLKFFQ